MFRKSFRFSRACHLCCCVQPHRRSVFTACGHTVCSACAMQMIAEARFENRALECSFCRSVGQFKHFVEATGVRKQKDEVCFNKWLVHKLSGIIKKCFEYVSRISLNMSDQAPRGFSPFFSLN